MIQRKNGERAGFDQDAHLLFGLFAQADLLLALGQVRGQKAPPLVQRVDEEPGHRVTCHRDAKPFSRPRRRAEGVEELAQQRAEQGQPENLEVIQGGGGKQDREQVEEPDGNIGQKGVPPGDQADPHAGGQVDRELMRFGIREECVQSRHRATFTARR